VLFRSIELEPGNPRPYYLRGITYRMTQEYSEALKDFNTAISLDPFQFDFLYARAQVYFHMGDYPESLADCERAGNIDPSVKEVEELKRIIRKKLRM
jgi:tetratricopeptide (TPR) repeat protein